MTRRTIVLGVVLLCFALPAALVVAAAAHHYLATRWTGKVVSGGRERDYILHVPRGHDRSKPAALVLSLHGGMNWPASQMSISRWNRVADDNHFLVAYPGAEGGGPGVWTIPGARTASRMSDVAFISDLIDRLTTEYNIDPARIYVNGFSQGGGMSFALSCTLSHRIAAIGLVGAAHFLPFEWCGDSRPVPMIAFHGTGERFTPYHGGSVPWLAPGHRFPGIPGFTAKWARRNGCAAAAVESAVAADVTRLDYPGCAANASVILYRIERGGHTWPGGTELPEWLAGPTSRGIDASRAMWAFFREHPLAR